MLDPASAGVVGRRWTGIARGEAVSTNTIGRVVCLALALGVSLRAQSGVTPPAAHFGFELTADGTFAMWDQEVAYYEKLARESDRVDLQVLGKSTQGRPFLLLTMSSPQNLAKAE